MVKYLNNEKISYAVPKYVNSKVEATDTGFVADMELNGVVERRPMYINGFLNFVQGEEEYANFTKLGANINGLSLKLYDVITPWCEVPEWNLYVRTKENADQKYLLSALRKGTLFSAFIIAVSSFFLITSILGWEKIGVYFLY